MRSQLAKIAIVLSVPFVIVSITSMCLGFENDVRMPKTSESYFIIRHFDTEPFHLIRVLLLVRHESISSWSQLIV